MSLVAHYELNNQATLLVDATANGHNLTNINGVGVTSDPTYGTVADFDSTRTQRLRIPVAPSCLVGNSTYTLSFWVKFQADDTSMFYGQGDGITYRMMFFSGYIYVRSLVSHGIQMATYDLTGWNYYTVMYDGTKEQVYINGSIVSEITQTPSRQSGTFEIGGSQNWPTGFGVYGQMVDFRIYDYALSSAEVSTIYTDGPPFTPVQIPFLVTPRVTSVRFTIPTVDGATAYRLTSQETGSTVERVVQYNFIALEQTAWNLTPGTEYTFRLYSTTTGSSYDLVVESTASTLQNLSINYDVNDFLSTSGRFDLSSLDTTSVGLMGDVMDELFSTGDDVDIVVPGRGTKISKFVNRGANVNISGLEAVVAPFTKDAGSGQSLSLTLSDDSVVDLSYDETTEAITVGTTSYTSGDSFLLDGKKATLVDI